MLTRKKMRHVYAPFINEALYLVNKQLCMYCATHNSVCVCISLNVVPVTCPETTSVTLLYSSVSVTTSEFEAGNQSWFALFL